MVKKVNKSQKRKGKRHKKRNPRKRKKTFGAGLSRGPPKGGVKFLRGVLKGASTISKFVKGLGKSYKIYKQKTKRRKK